MLSPQIHEAINSQIQKELSSSYVYLSMAAHFEAANLPGFARWMRSQSQEEQGHAMRLFDFVHARGGRVVLQAIQQPPVEFGSPLAVMQQALAHEQAVTQAIHELYDIAWREKDYATTVQLQWFITEQIEEESTVNTIVDHLKLVAGEATGILLMDQQLGQRATSAGGEADGST